MKDTHGTKLNNPIQLSSRDLCELYAKIRIDIAKFQSVHGGILQALGRQTRQVPNKFQDTEYFINDHHAHQFQKTFPDVWSALNCGVTAANRGAFDNGIRILRNMAPTTYVSLENRGHATGYKGGQMAITGCSAVIRSRPNGASSTSCT
jgi:hypothetical protein